MPRNHFLSVALLLLAMALPSELAAQLTQYVAAWEKLEECRRGSRKCNWDEVANAMEAATREAEDTGKPVRLAGVQTEMHLPYYYLGLARQMTGDDDGAVVAWVRSCELGFVKADEKKYDRILAQLRGAYRTYYAAGRESFREQEWDGVLAHMKKALAIESLAAQGMVDVFHPNAGEVIAIAQIRLDSKDDLARAAEALSELAQARPAWVLGRNEELGKRRESARETLDGIRTAFAQDPETADKGAIAAAAKRLPELVRTLEGLIRQSAEHRETYQADREVLKKAADRFFNGREKEKYEAVVMMLAERSFSDAQLEAQAALFRAFSLYAMFLQGKEGDLEKAKDQLRKCRALEPDPRYFSPRFISFFKESS